MISETRPSGFVPTTFQRVLAVREDIASVRPAGELETREDREKQYKQLGKLVYSITPIISDIKPNGSVVLRKYESYRPSGSHYDPVYFQTFKELELARYFIKSGDDLYEVTSGSAGTSFAWLANRLGYNAHIFVPSSLPEGRKQEMRNFGADLVEIGDENAYVPEASRAETRAFLAEAKRTGHKVQPPVKDDKFNLYYAVDDAGHKMVLVNHSENGITPFAMEDILQQAHVVLPDEAKIDNIISVIGNGVSSTGLHRARQRLYPDARLIGLESYDSAVLYRDKYPGKAEEMHLQYKPQRMFGSIVPGMRLPFMDHEIFDEIRLVDGDEMDTRMRMHNAGRPVIESIGMSSAASMIIAEQLADEQPGSVTLSLVYDGGYRYGEPVIETGRRDETWHLDEYRQMPLVAPWIPTPYKDFASMPHSVREAFHRVTWQS